MNIGQFLRNLGYWNLAVWVISILAVGLVFRKALPLFREKAVGLWTRAVEKKNNLNRGEILIISIILEMALIAAFVPAFFLFSFSRMLFIGILAAELLALLLVDFLIIYFWWAPNNLYFTFVPEGRAKIVVKGRAYKKTLIQWAGYDLATEQKEDADIGDVVEGKSRKRFFGGLRYYGFWPLCDIYVYNFSWTSVEQSGDIKEHLKEVLDYALLMYDVYFGQVDKAETKDLLPLNIRFIITAKILNPYKAIHRIENWLQAVMNRIVDVIRDKIKEKKYREWIEEKDDLADLILRDKETKKMLKTFKDVFGIEINAIEVLDINPGDDLRQETLRKFIGEQEAERIKVVYDEIAGHGDVGKLIRTLEALEKSPGEGAKWIIPLPGGSDLISKVFSGGGQGVPIDSRLVAELKDLLTALKEQKEKT